MRAHAFRTVLTSLGIVCAGPLILTGCGSDPTPLHPSPTATPNPSTSVIRVTDLRVGGPASLPPGETAQFTATASFSDGSTRDVTSEATWTSADASVIAVTAAGRATARSNGTAEVQAALFTISNMREVIVVPAGRYRLQVYVREDQAAVPIDGVRVEVMSGAAVGLAATTDWDGRAVLYGVTEDAQLQFSKAGYETRVQSVHIVNNYTPIGVQLLASGSRVDLPGGYQLTISSGSCENGAHLPPDATSRTYAARMWNEGLNVVVELDDANFALAYCPLCHETRGNRFVGQAQPLGARFTLIDYSPPMDWNDGIYPDVVERLANGSLLTIAGRATVAPTAGGLAGTLDGAISIYADLDLVSAGSSPAAVCRSSSHGFTLVRQGSR
jgi:hypothetical protein